MKFVRVDKQEFQAVSFSSLAVGEVFAIGNRRRVCMKIDWTNHAVDLATGEWLECLPHAGVTRIIAELHHEPL